MRRAYTATLGARRRPPQLQAWSRSAVQRALSRIVPGTRGWYTATVLLAGAWRLGRSLGRCLRRCRLAWRQTQTPHLRKCLRVQNVAIKRLST